MVRISLPELIATFQAKPPQLWQADQLSEQMAQWKLTADSLAPHLQMKPGRYTRNLLYRDATFELMLNCWDRDAISPVHDHGEASCWLSVQAGRFLFEDYSLLEGGREPGYARLELAQKTLAMKAGWVDFKSYEASVHRVRAAEGPAVSLHLYARPLDSCLVYDLKRRQCSTRQLFYDSSLIEDFLTLRAPGAVPPGR